MSWVSILTKLDHLLNQLIYVLILQILVLFQKNNWKKLKRLLTIKFGLNWPSRRLKRILNLLRIWVLLLYSQKNMAKSFVSLKLVIIQLSSVVGHMLLIPAKLVYLKLFLNQVLVLVFAGLKQ